MTNDLAEFDAENATLQMSRELAARAATLARTSGGEPASALFGAALHVLRDTYGQDGLVDIARRWMETLAAASSKSDQHS